MTSLLNDAMYGMILDEPGHKVQSARLPRPQPGPDELLIKVAACAVCRTDLHVVDGDLPNPNCLSFPDMK